MKMKTKVSIILVFALLFVLVMSLSSFATSDYFIDETGEWSSMHSSLEAKLADISEKNNVNVLIYAYPGYLMEDDEILEKFNLTTYDDVVILVFTKFPFDEDWHLYLATYGMPNDAISDSEVDYLMRDDGIMEYARTENMEDGLYQYIDYIDQALQGNSVPIYARLTIPILLGLLGALIGFLSVFISYKRKVRSDCYPLKEFTNMDLTYSDDRFTGSHVSRQYSPRNKGSSGGRSGGGGRRGGR